MTYLLARSSLILLLVTAMLGLPIAGCHQESGNPEEAPSTESVQSTSSLASRPLIILSFMDPTNTILSTKAHQPLLDYLTAQTPFRYRAIFSSESERNVGVLEERLVEISHLGVVSYLEAHNQFGAVPIAKPLNRDGEPTSRSVLITREDTDIGKLTDLRGTLFGTGIIPFHVEQPSYRVTSSHPSGDRSRGSRVLGAFWPTTRRWRKAVLAGRFDAGAVEDIVAARYEQKGLRPFHVSGPIPTGPLAIREDLPRRVESAVRDALLKLGPKGVESRQDWAEEIRYGFQPAADSDYEPLRKIMMTVPTGCSESCHGSS